MFVNTKRTKCRHKPYLAGNPAGSYKWVYDNWSPENNNNKTMVLS